ncbi:putative peptidase [bacterium HR32]|nr:putative peptidase [bacterium HR32]
MRDDRLARLRARTHELGVHLPVLSPGDDLRYLAGWSPLRDERFFALLVAPDGLALVSPELAAETASRRVGAEVYPYADAQGPRPALRAALARLGPLPQRVAVCDDLRADHLLLLQEHLRQATFQLVSALTAPLRARKDLQELEAMRRSQAAADAAVLAAWTAARPGVSELEVAEAAAAAARQAGAESVPFALVASGPNTADPHHEPNRRRLRPEEALLVDVGARWDGYCSDVTRVGFLGQPVGRYLEVHGVVERALRAALDAVRPGVPACRVDRAAREVITAAGYGPYFVHRTGHGLGLSPHEPPSVHGEERALLEEGMVITVEPGVYLPGEFGVRLEEAVVVLDSGPEILSRLPRDVFPCPGPA